MSSLIAEKCVDDVIEKLKATEEFGAAGKEKIFTVYSEGDLFDKTKIVKMPAVGIMYEGISANGNDPSRQGLSCDISVALVLIIDGKSVGNLDQKNEAARILDVIRENFKTNNRVSPTGHKWRFASEKPIGDVGNLLVYVQRWQSAVMIA